MSPLKTLALAVVASLSLQPAVADQVDSAAAETTSPDTVPEPDIDRVRSQFEDLLIAKATDFSESHATQLSMSKLALKHLQPDDRFNQPIREVLLRYADGRSAEDSEEESKPLALALQLFELTTFSPDEAVELLLKTMMSENPTIDESARNRIYFFLSNRPDATSRQVLEALRRGERSGDLFWLTGITGESSAAVAAELLKIAKGDDPELASAALQPLAAVISNVERFKQRHAAGLTSEANSKYLNYAGRIINRYDRNHDGRLTKDEFGTMLMSPEAADVDKDGSITAAEYAVWLAERNQPRQDRRRSPR